MSFLDFIFAGDLILDEPNADHWLAGIAPALCKADIAIGHLEVPHTLRGREQPGDVPAPAADPENIFALERAGFRALTLAGNHIADCGADGIADTLHTLNLARLKFTGAGLTLAEATTPARLIHGENRIALLSYNCVGPELSWASESRAGCAYVRVETANGEPIAPASSLDHANPKSLASMVSDIVAARSQANIIIVALHKGIVHTPARLAPYEQAIAHAAIDAGADIVIGHHAHIVRGIEMYRDKPIFHGLGNGCVVTRALSPDQSHPARAAWARKRRELFGFDPDPAYFLAPFHPEAVNGMLGRVRVKDGALKVGFVPLHVEPPGKPVIAVSEQAMRVIDYIKRITIDAGLSPITPQFDGECAWLN